MQLQPQFTDYFKNLIATLKQKILMLMNWWMYLVSDGKQNLSCFRETARTRTQLSATQPLAKISPLDLFTISGRPARLMVRVSVSHHQGDTNNTDLLKQGISKPPATYAELAQIAKQIKDKTGKCLFLRSSRKIRLRC